MKDKADCLANADALDALAADARSLADRAELTGMAARWRTAAIVALHKNKPPGRKQK